MPSTALFVVDIQNELANDANTEIPHAGRIRGAGGLILNKARAAIDSARAAERKPDLCLVFVQHEEKPGDGELVSGSTPWQLVFPARAGDETERLVHKDVRDTFEPNPQLASQLKEEGVKTLIIFGIQSECCVLSTAKGALVAGFQVILLSGAHSTYDADGKTATEIEAGVEKELEAEGAEVFAWEEWQPSA